MPKYLKYSLLVVAIFLFIWLSLDIQPLEDSGKPGTFDATAYSADLWVKEIPSAASAATDISKLIAALRSDPAHTIENSGHKLGISKTVYFMVKGSGKVIKTEDENIIVETEDGLTVAIATDFIFGNAVRDGSGVVNIDDFLNMTDFNNVSVALNKLVKEKVVPALKKEAAPGSRIRFAGAIEVNEKSIDPESLRIIPVQSKIIP